jgi:YD repeat-containing protein
MKLNFLYKSLVLTFFFIHYSVMAFGQQALEVAEQAIAAPNAAELGKYGSFPVGNLSGIPNIGFPLFEINTGKLKLPIRLSYHAGGNQVNQKAPDVGLGWSVMAGGTISRTVFGASDESTYGSFNYLPPGFSSLMGTKSFYTLKRYNIVKNLGYDLEPDLFHYNFNGKSGKFIYKPDESAFLTIPYDPILIRKYGDLPGRVSFKLTDENGTVYTFAVTSTTTWDDISVASSWHLTSMVSADRTDTISFVYEKLLSTEFSSNHYQMVGRDQRSSVDSQLQKVETTVSHAEMLLKKITFKNGYVLFNRNKLRKDNYGTGANSKSLDELLVYTTSNERVKKISFAYGYFYSPEKSGTAKNRYRLKLLGFTEEGAASGGKTYQFDYNNKVQLPPYGSFSIDYWGFYNGKANTNLIPKTMVYGRDLNAVRFINGDDYANVFPKNQTWQIGGADRHSSAEHMQAGIIQKVTYPTGGFTRYEFEPHQFTRDRQEKETITHGGRTRSIDVNTKSEDRYHFSPDRDVNAVASIRFSRPAPPTHPYLPVRTQEVVLRDLTTGSVILRKWHDQNPNFPLQFSTEIPLKQNHQYRMTVTVYGNYHVVNKKLIAMDVDAAISWETSSREERPTIGAGLRIKSIKHFERDSTLLMQNTYVSGENEDGMGIKLFDEGFFSNHYEDQVIDYFKDSGSGFCTLETTALQRKLNGFSKYNSLNYMGSSVLYPTVTQYEGTPADNIGKTAFYYNIMVPDVAAVPDEFIQNGKYGAFGNIWNQGELLKKISYKKSGEQYFPVSKEMFEYSVFGQRKGSRILLKQFKQPIIIDNCSFFSPQGPKVSDPKYGQGYFSLYRQFIETGTSRRTKAVHIEYGLPDHRDSLVKVTTFRYDNLLHAYPTETVTFLENGDELVKRNYYPDDVGSRSKLGKPELTPTEFNAISRLKFDQSNEPSSLHRIRDLVQTETIVRDSLGKERSRVVNRTLFRDFGSFEVYPERVSSLYGPYSDANPMQEEWVFRDYDSYGNPLEISNRGKRMVYLWGYRGRYPVAKIENATYSQVIATGVDPAILQSLSSSDEKRRRELDKLRQGLPDALVTTYLYRPIIGLKQVTDARGNNLYYDYDTQGRLGSVKDTHGKIVKLYQYGYALGQ